MALTNAELIRREVGDGGTFIRDVASGDAGTTVFYLSTVPILPDSNFITVNGATQTEVSANPVGGQYTLDDDSGKVVFGAAPGAGTDNIVSTYKGVAVPQTDIDEACRQYGLTSTATAETDMPAAVLEAAALVCDWRASAVANEFDFDTDGQSFKRGSLAGAWAARADAIRARLRRRFGIVSTPVTRLDGYTVRGEYDSRSTTGTSVNPRRQFYGEPDRIP